MKLSTRIFIYLFSLEMHNNYNLFHPLPNPISI